MRELRYTIETGKIRQDALTIALVSDFHNGDAHAVAAVLEKNSPDLVAVTGDLFLGARHEKEKSLFELQPNVLPMIQSCVKAAPTFISLGNHEWAAGRKELRVLEESGAAVLDNRFISLEESGIVIGGLTSAVITDYRNFKKTFGNSELYSGRSRKGWTPTGIQADWLELFTARDGFRILLSHHPEYWCLEEPMLCQRKIDLVLSGHAHGGQIRLLGQGLYSPGQGLFPKYAGGLYRGPWGSMVVSRGTTNTARFIPRLFNPPEVDLIEIRHSRTD